jgi:hypothetical protein
MSNESDLAAKLATGTQKHLSKVGHLILGSGELTPEQVTTRLNAFATLRKDVDTAKAVVKAKLENERSQRPAMRAFIHAFVAYVRMAFGNSPDVLAEFGLQPKKVRKVLTIAEKAAAKAKREATRKARGTIGKRKKLAIKGDVTGVVVTPVTSSSPHAEHAPDGPPNANPPNGTRVA